MLPISIPPSYLGFAVGGITSFPFIVSNRIAQFPDKFVRTRPSDDLLCSFTCYGAGLSLFSAFTHIDHYPDGQKMTGFMVELSTGLYSAMAGTTVSYLVRHLAKPSEWVTAYLLFASCSAGIVASEIFARAMEMSTILVPST